MQENNLVPTPLETPQIIVDQPKQSNFLVILLSILLFISVVISGFFAFQTQKLVKELTSLKNEEKVVSTTEPTTEPVATESSEVDLVDMSWRKISLLNYDFRAPNNWKYLECNKSMIFVGPNIEKDSKEVCEFDGSRGLINVSRLTDLSLFKIPTNTDPNLDPYITKKENIIIGGRSAIRQVEKVSSGMGEGQRIYVYVLNQGYVDIIVLQDVSQEKLFDQILSTFKFLD